MMQRSRWLALAATTSFAYLFLHQPVQLQVQGLRDTLGGPGFSILFLALATAFVLIIIGTSLRARSRRTLTSHVEESENGPSFTRSLPHGALWVGTLLAAGLSYWVIVAVESELVHWPQFTFLYLLFFAWCRLPGQAAVWTGLAGILDEAYQYWVLQAHWNIYLDWNDIVLNLIAAAFGVCLVTSLGTCTRHQWVWKSVSGSATKALALVSATLSMTLATQALGIYRSQAPGAWRVLSRSDPPQRFWTFASWSRKDFHILSPMEGMLITTVLFVALLAVDGWLSCSRRPQEPPVVH